MERWQAARRHTAMRRPGVLAMAGVLLLSGCADSDSGATAVWTVRTGHQVGPDATTFTAMVRRLGCNNGDTGDIHEPDVKVEDEKVVVTFTVDPIRTDATCPDNDEVPYEVALPEPLGNRSLVDGQCESDTDASRTGFCRPNGVRYNPD